MKHEEPRGVDPFWIRFQQTLGVGFRFIIHDDCTGGFLLRIDCIHTEQIRLLESTRFPSHKFFSPCRETMILDSRVTLMVGSWTKPNKSPL